MYILEHCEYEGGPIVQTAIAVSEQAYKLQEYTIGHFNNKTNKKDWIIEGAKIILNIDEDSWYIIREVTLL